MGTSRDTLLREVESLKAALSERDRDIDAQRLVIEMQRVEVEAQRNEALAQRHQVDMQREEIRRLEHNLGVLRRMLFGPRSEKRPQAVTPGQAVMEFADLVAMAERVAQEKGAVATVEAKREGMPRKPGRRKSFPPHFPVVRTTYRLQEEDLACVCGHRLQEMGEEVTQELERVEVSIVHEIARVKYACRSCREGVRTAPGPDRPIEKGILGVGFLAHVLTERFLNHMPYARQESKYASEGLDLSRSTLCEAAGRAAKLLEPIYEEIAKEVMASDVVGTDDTPVQVREPAHRGFVWAYRDLGGRCVYDFTHSRSRDGPARWLSSFRGFLVADRYAGYEAFYGPGGCTEVGCWAHVRRKFVDAETSDPELSKEAVRRIAILYGVEEEARDLDASSRAALRREKSLPEIESFFDWMAVTQGTVLPESPMGRAIAYAFSVREALARYVTDGRLPIDNNAVERALRRVAIGRKNWMFVGNENGGRTAAILYSLVQTCREIGVNPREYFRDVLLRVKTGADVKALTPHAWKQRFEPEVRARRDEVVARLLSLAP